MKASIRHTARPQDVEKKDGKLMAIVTPGGFEAARKVASVTRLFSLTFLPGQQRKRAGPSPT